MREFASDYLNVAYCAKTLNSVYASGAVSGLTPPNVRSNSDGTPDRFAKEAGVKVIHTYEFKDRNEKSPLAGGSAVCGTVNLYTYESKKPTLYADYVARYGADNVYGNPARVDNVAAINLIRDAILSAKRSSVKAMMQEIDVWVNQWPAHANEDWSGVHASKFNNIVDNAQSRMLATLKAKMESDTTLKTIMDKFTKGITKDGWAMAGGYYQRLSGVREELRKIYSESPGHITSPALGWLPKDAKGTLVRQSMTMPYTITQKAIDGSGYTPTSITDTANAAGIVPTDFDNLDIDQVGKRGDKIMNSMVGLLMESVTDVAIGADGNVDSIARIKVAGDIMAVAGTTFSATQKILELKLAAVRVGGGVLSAIPVIGNAVKNTANALADYLEKSIVNALVPIIRWLDLLAFYFGVFLPSLPYTIFIIAVVGWLLAVLQTVFAAPLWAVMHMTPERTFIGSQQQGYLMFLSLFIKPALIVVALFAAMLLANPIILYVSKAFWAMRTANVSSADSLGFLIQFLTWKNWLIMYGMLLLPIVYMIFGLTNALPDAILTWIGAGIKPLGETEATAQMRAGMERHGAMRTANSLLGGGARKKQDKLKDQRQDEKTDKDAKDDRLMHSDTVVSNQQDYVGASGYGAGAGAGGAGGAGASGAAGGTAAAGAAAGATAGTSLVATKGSAIAQDVGGGQGAFTGHASGFKADNPMHDGASVASPNEGDDLYGDRSASGGGGETNSKAA